MLIGPSCGEASPESGDASVLEDSGADAASDAAHPTDGGVPQWAPWPPEPGNSGLHFSWTIAGSDPDSQSCLDAGVSALTLYLLSPDRKETWTSSGLTAPCTSGFAEIPQGDGLCPGDYRFKIDVCDLDGGIGAQHPEGVVRLVSGEETLAARVDISSAVPGDD